MVLPTSVQKQMEQLWDGLTQFGSARCDEALTFLLGELARLIDAQQAYWLGSVRMVEKDQNDPLRGWRPRNVYYLHERPERRAAFQKHVERFDKNPRSPVDPSVLYTLRDAGQFRVNAHRKILPDTWFQSTHYKNFYEAFGITDTILVTMPISEDMESWIGLQRINHDTPHFSEGDCELLAQAVRPTRWFHQQLAHSHGLLLVDSPLTPSERRVLHALLGEWTEAEIADQLNLSPNTVHTYSKRICNKFGVRGRTGLTALWLGR